MAITAAMVKELRETTGLGMMTCKKALTEANGDMELAIENLRKKGQATAEKRAGKDATEGGVVAKVSDSNAVIFRVNCETDFSANSNDFIEVSNKIGDALLAAKPTTLEDALKVDVDGETVEEACKTLGGKIGEKVEVKEYNLITINDNQAAYSYIHSNRRVGAVVVLSSDNSEILSNDEVVTLGKDLAMQISAAAPKALKKEDLDEALVAKEKEIYLEQLKNEGKPAELAEKIVIGKMNKFFKENTLVGQEFIKADKVTVEKHVSEVAKSAGAPISIDSYVRVELN